MNSKSRISLCVWLFLALSCISVLSPVTAVDDELMHLSAIWCVNGVDNERCLALSEDPQNVTRNVLMPNSDLLGADTTISATTNIDFAHCKYFPNEIYNCPTAQQGTLTSLVSNSKLFPGWTYELMHFVVGADVERSVVRIRLLTALIVSLVFLGLLCLPNPRAGSVAIGAMLICMQPFGWFLVSSVSPSGLASIGVATSWLFLYSALVDHHVSIASRARNVFLALITSMFALGSRLDTAVFLLLTYACLFAVLIVRRVRERERTSVPKPSIVIGVLSLGAVLVFALRTTKFGAIGGLLLSGNESGVEDAIFFSHNLLQVFPIWFQATGSVSAHTGVVIPQISGVLMTLLLGILLISQISHLNAFQFIGISSAVVGALVINVLWTGVFDSRTLFGPSVRYTFPLLLFACVWLVVFSGSIGSPYQSTNRRILEFCYILSFALSIYSIGERFVDRQTFGLRVLPEGPDQWWWSWLPLGPNAVVIIGTYCMYRVLASYRNIDTSSGIDR